ncbi:hypothetical protein PoB_004929900 [Plakobranchus ocellatus]|uniref:Uncharacterized protein n=1 Tax=Plakobranchus ocellatus TaxID=259542 RepID=A0AAV4BVF5_9GAST|nr:hypothetical protein PoB_004929900 [Plakobranchus ocellatus]
MVAKVNNVDSVLTDWRGSGFDRSIYLRRHTVFKDGSDRPDVIWRGRHSCRHCFRRLCRPAVHTWQDYACLI